MKNTSQHRIRQKYLQSQTGDETVRERHTQQKTISFTKTMYEKIRKAASEFEASFAEVVRECINRELDRFIDREKKRKQSQRNP
ncbi:hypothetical protein F4X73_13290 [Candidatus Poribacteria bacterium]|nr:hypothetical protein [Candidatus Poribacteria bacterium]